MRLLDLLLNKDRHSISFNVGRIINESSSVCNRIAIARDFAVLLRDNDWELELIGRNPEFRQLCRTTKKRFVKLAAGFDGYMALADDGCVYVGPRAREFECGIQIEQLRDVADIVACEGHTVALHNNGRITCIDEPGGWEGVPNHSHIVQEWHNIKQVAVGYANIMGLTNEGRVLYHSEDGYTNPHFYDSFSDIVQVDCYSHYYGTDSSMVLHRDGTVSSDTFDGVESWKNIIQISVGADVGIGLKSDGSVEMVDKRKTRYEVKNWNHLVGVLCKFFGVVCITKEGEVRYLFAQP